MNTNNISHKITGNLEFILHLLAWITIFVLPHVLFIHDNNNGAARHTIVLLGAPFCLALVFYVNYLWLVPRYLLGSQHKSKKKFIAFNIILFLISLTILNIWNDTTNRPGPFGPPIEQNISNSGSWDKNNRKEETWQVRKTEKTFFPKRPKSTFASRLIFETRDFLLFVLVTILAILILQSKNFRKAERARQLAELRQSEAEVKSLINQLSPHFLLNTLNNIYTLVAINPQLAQESIDNLSKMLRHMLYENRKEYTTLEKDVNFVVKYIELMKLRLSSDVDVQYKIDIEQARNIVIKPLILIPLIENAFKHGVCNTEPSFIHAEIVAKPTVVYCRIENSNHPKEQTDRSGNGIGIELIKKRLDLAYPGKYTLTYGPSNDGKIFTSELIVNKT